MNYRIHTPQTATPPADAVLAALDDKLGFVPNVFAVMGGTPQVLDAFVTLNERFAASSLSSKEREIVQMAVSVTNNCAYCVAGHTAFLEKLQTPANMINSMRHGQSLEDAKMEALRRFAEVMSQTKGHVSNADTEAFLRAGFTSAQAQEVVLGICVKTFSNLIGNLLNIPLDDVFAPYRWNGCDEHVGRKSA